MTKSKHTYDNKVWEDPADETQRNNPSRKASLVFGLRHGSGSLEAGKTNGRLPDPGGVMADVLHLCSAGFCDVAHTGVMQFGL